jgi:hypothetical protein
MIDERLHDLLSLTDHVRRKAQLVLAENRRLLLRSREVISRASEALADARAEGGRDVGLERLHRS